MMLRLGIQVSRRGLSLSLLRPSRQVSFFKPNTPRMVGLGAKSALFKREFSLKTQGQSLRGRFQDLFKQQRKYATYSELGAREANYSGSGSKRSKPNFNNMQNNVWKPALFTLAFSVATYYGSPWLFNNTPLRYLKTHPAYLLYGMIGVNCVIFGLWQIKYQSSTLYRILNDYFLMDRSSLTRKTYWSMIGSTFSHQEFFHLLINMGCFYSFATTMIRLMGVADFTSLYLISGCVGSLASMIFSFATKRYGCSLGASAAISGVFAAFTAMFPTASVAFFVFPIPGGAQTALALFTAYNLAGMVLRWSTFDFAAHLGGTLVGFIWGLQLKDRAKKMTRRVRSYYR